MTLRSGNMDYGILDQPASGSTHFTISEFVDFTYSLTPSHFIHSYKSVTVMLWCSIQIISIACLSVLGRGTSCMVLHEIFFFMFLCWGSKGWGCHRCAVCKSPVKKIIIWHEVFICFYTHRPLAQNQVQSALQCQVKLYRTLRYKLDTFEQ